MNHKTVLAAGTLLATFLLTISSVWPQQSLTTVSTFGTIRYSYPDPPEPPSGEYYNVWQSDFRVDSQFTSFLSGSTFDFTGFFQQLYTRFLSELETTTFGAGYTRPTLDYGTPTYNPGEPVGNLRSVANKIVSTTAELQAAFNSEAPGDIIFIESGTYVVSTLRLNQISNIIIAGNGWDTVLYLEDGVNFPVIYATGGGTNVIFRDLKIVGNAANNPDNAMTYGIDLRNGYEYTFTENVYITNCRRMGWCPHDGAYNYIFNSLVEDCGWNDITPCRDSWDAVIGNYVTAWRDVGITTWATDHIVIANNVCVYPVADVGFGGGNIAIMGENQNPGSYVAAKDTHDVIVRNNIASECHAFGYDLRWRGTGIWFSSLEEETQGCYNIIIDGNVVENNNCAGVKVTTSMKYPGETWGSTVVVVNNYAAGNDIYNMEADGSPHFGDYVIYRPGVVFENNVEA